MTNTALSY